MVIVSEILEGLEGGVVMVLKGTYYGRIDKVERSELAD